MELDHSKRNITAPVISTVPFDHFIKYAHVAKDDYHITRLELYTKVADFIDLFVKIKEHEKKEKDCQEINESLMATIDTIEKFQKVQKDASSQIP